MDEHLNLSFSKGSYINIVGCITILFVQAELPLCYWQSYTITYKFWGVYFSWFSLSNGHLWNFHPWKFIGKTLACTIRRARYMWTAMFGTIDKFQPYQLQLQPLKWSRIGCCLIEVNYIFGSFCIAQIVDCDISWGNFNTSNVDFLIKNTLK